MADGDAIFEGKYFHRLVKITPDGKRHVESGKSHVAFRKYLDLGPKRTVQQVAKELSKSRTLISRWCQQWNWKERAQIGRAHV